MIKVFEIILCMSLKTIPPMCPDDKNDFSTGFVYFTDKTLNIPTYSFAGTVLANIIEKCKGWVNDFILQ
jgi:hypothetical protein